jgi:2-C-methyl-D-erythritol 4-phosphate cytidylyltransferase
MKKGERIYAIIPAAGQGSRMGADYPNKQFLDLQGMPILIRTLLVFEKSPIVDGIAIAVGASEIDLLKAMCEKYKITKLIGITPGGLTRQDSVRGALAFLSTYLTTKKIPASTTIVLIHDGARPFVTGAILERCIEGVKKYRACGAGVQVKDTIKQVHPDGRILHTPSREGLWAIQTPQAFLFSLIERLHEKAFLEGLAFTDDTAIAEYFGQEVRMIQGDYRNIKITTPEDLIYGEALLKQDSEEKSR